MKLKSKNEAVMLSEQINSSGIKLPFNCKIQVMLTKEEFDEFVEEVLYPVLTDQKLKKSISRQNGVEMTISGIWYHFKTNE